jgi:hypothetical protein
MRGIRWRDGAWLDEVLYSILRTHPSARHATSRIWGHGQEGSIPAPQPNWGGGRAGGSTPSPSRNTNSAHSSRAVPTTDWPIRRVGALQGRLPCVMRGSPPE